MISRGNRLESSPRLELVLEYIYVVFGSAIVALAFNLFLLPNQIASGGVSGINTILHSVFGWEPALFS